MVDIFGVRLEPVHDSGVELGVHVCSQNGCEHNESNQDDCSLAFDHFCFNIIIIMQVNPRIPLVKKYYLVYY